MTELSQRITCPGSRLAEDEAITNPDERFAALVVRQSRFVFRVAYSAVRNVHDAEDVVQETFLKLYRTGAWNRMGDEKAFLARTAWRIAQDRRTKPQLEAELPDAVSHESSPEQAALAKDWSATVHRLIDTLPPELREPLVLSTLEELTSQEISALLGIPDGTVRHRVMRARQILKQKLAALQGSEYAK